MTSFCLPEISAKVFLNSLTICSFFSILHHMPITRGAKKKLRQDIKRTTVNLLIKNKVKKTIKNYKLAPTKEKLAAVYSFLDITKKKRFYHANKTARLKSRLSRLLKKKVGPVSLASQSQKKKSSPKQKGIKIV